MKIQISKTKTIEWAAPWEKTSTMRVSDVVGIELGAGNPAGCPAVRLQRVKDGIGVAAVGFVPPPPGEMPNSWGELKKLPRWSLPAAFRADYSSLALFSPDSSTRQTTQASFQESAEKHAEGVAYSKDGVRFVSRKMADEGSVLQATLPEYQALWANRLFPEGHRPAALSLQTTTCALLAALTKQPGFCEEQDEIAVFVTSSAISIAGFRQGIPLLYRDCPGAAGTAAMREAVKTAFGIDDSMLETVFASNGIIDTQPALGPLLTPVVSQIELSIEYMRSRLGSEVKRLILAGDAAGCSALKRVVDKRLNVPVVMVRPFEGLILPTKSVAWKEQYCVGELQQIFLAALGAALAVMEEQT